MVIEGMLKFIVVIGLLYFGYQLILKHTPFGSKEESFNVPAPANLPPNLPPSIYAPERPIAAAGPSAPVQMAEPDAEFMPPESAVDPYAEQNESANAPEKLRNPERMFRPAPPNDNYDAIPGSGIGGMAVQQTSNSMQTFAPEFAQNGGSFMGEVFANDTDLPTNFSDF